MCPPNMPSTAPYPWQTQWSVAICDEVGLRRITDDQNKALGSIQSACMKAHEDLPLEHHHKFFTIPSRNIEILRILIPQLSKATMTASWSNTASFVSIQSLSISRNIIVETSRHRRSSLRSSGICYLAESTDMVTAFLFDAWHSRPSSMAKLTPHAHARYETRDGSNQRDR